MPGFEWCSLVPVVLGLFTFGYITCLYTVFYSWLGLSTAGLINFFCAHVLIYNLYYNYWKAVTTDPGSIPENWTPPGKILKQQAIQLEHMEDDDTKPRSSPFDIMEPSEATEQKENEDPNLAVRFCKKCRFYKAPRSHHCSECDRCVLKMDHHCPWINNCVGHRNHKNFVLFLIYLGIEGIYFLVLFIWRIMILIQEAEQRFNAGNGEEAESYSIIVAILCAIQLMIIVPTVLGVSCLFGYQMKLIVNNTTCIEELEKEMEERKAKRNGTVYRYPYDRGVVENLKSVFGSTISTWLISTAPEHDGLNFPIHKSIDA